MRNITISIVVPAYNEEKYIGSCLKNLTNQLDPADEIIVVDNNCTDKTVEVAKKFPIRIVHESKQGMIPARNRGFDEVKSDIIARCDADTLVPSDWVKKIKNNMLNSANDALTGPIFFYDSPIKSTIFAIIYQKVMTLLLKNHHVIYGPNMILRKSLWQKIKNNVCLDDKAVHEDIDISIHIAQADGRVGYDPHLTIGISARRIKSNPLSFFGEYTVRAVKTICSHNS